VNTYPTQPSVAALGGIAAASVLILSIFLPCEAAALASATYIDLVTKISETLSPFEWLLIVLVCAGSGLALAGCIARALPNGGGRGAALLGMMGFGAGLAGEILWIIDFMSHADEARGYGLSVGLGVWIGCAAAVAGLVLLAVELSSSTILVRPGANLARRAVAPAVAGPARAALGAQAGVARLAYVEGGRPTSVDVQPGQRLLIGRDATANIRLTDPRVSRRHLIVERHANGWLVQDLGATNPTRLVGSGGTPQTIHGETSIASGQLLVGDVLVTLFAS
jgi:hypothetical protein